MESHEIIRDAFQRSSPKLIAAEMGLSLSLVYKWSQPSDGSGSGVENPLDRVAQLIELTGDARLIQWLCQRLGGYFVRNPKTKPGHETFDLIPTYTEIIQQFADVLESITDAAADRSITQDEAEKIRRLWDNLKAYTEGFVRACEEGDFERIRHQAAG